MKLFVKMLTIASIVMAGTGASADGTEAVADSHRIYREVFDTYTAAKKNPQKWEKCGKRPLLNLKLFVNKIVQEVHVELKVVIMCVLRVAQQLVIV